jgi:hypothetical protein
MSRRVRRPLCCCTVHAPLAVFSVTQISCSSLLYAHRKHSLHPALFQPCRAHLQAQAALACHFGSSPRRQLSTPIAVVFPLHLILQTPIQSSTYTQDDDRRDDRWGGRRDDRWGERRHDDDTGGPITSTIEATKEKLGYAKNKAEEEASRLKQKAEETAGE